MTFLEHKIPPPIVGLLWGVAMWYLAGPGPLDALPGHVRIIGGVLVGLLGFAIMLAGVLSFRRARTTVNPLDPKAATALVTNGIFRYTRNPMYLGMLVVLLGWSFYLAAPLALLGVLGFWMYIDRFQIRPEEKALTELFGSRFTDYQSRVRRWL